MGMDERRGPVLILAPTGRDAVVAATILSEVGLVSTVCPDLDALVSDLDQAGGVIVTEEALLHSDRRALADWIHQQPPWSDFPFVLLTSRGGHADAGLTELLGNVTILERPFHPSVLVNAVRCATRARQRQREAEAYLLERKRSEEHQSLLIRELQHRVKNTLATVQALLRATSRSASTVEDFKRVFEARVLSLSRTHNLLSSSSMVGQQMAVSFGIKLDDSLVNGAVEVIRAGEGLMSEAMPLQVAPDPFNTVQLRGVFRQPLDREPVGARRDGSAACLTRVDRAVVEDKHDGLEHYPELGTIAPINLLQQSNEVRASFGPAGAHDELATSPIEHAEHRYFGALARGRNAQVGPLLGPDVRQIRMGERFGLVAEQKHDVACLSLGREQLSA